MLYRGMNAKEATVSSNASETPRATCDARHRKARQAKNICPGHSPPLRPTGLKKVPAESQTGAALNACVLQAACVADSTSSAGAGFAGSGSSAASRWSAATQAVVGSARKTKRSIVQSHCLERGGACTSHHRDMITSQSGSAKHGAAIC